MTLKQAFTQWAAAPRNTVLAARSRDAVQRVLMRQYGDMHLEVFTEAFCRRLFSESSERLELQVKAASILVHVLSWGGDHDHCQRPSFTYEIASEVSSKKVQVSSKADAQGGEALETCNLKLETNGPASGQNRDKIEPKTTSNETSNETTMEQQTTKKKPRGNPPRPVVQIDPTTLEAVREWPSMTEAASAVGSLSGNIHRAVTQLRTAGGYYWTDPDGVADFKGRLARKKSTPRSQRALASSINRGKRKPAGDAKAEKAKAEKEQQPKEQKTLVQMVNDAHRQSLERMERKKQEQAQQVQSEPTDTDAAANLEPSNLEPAREPLDQYTDDELSRELKRRGWQGELTKTLSV